MKIILSHYYDIKDYYFVIDIREETLEKFFLKLATILIITYNLDHSFDLEVNVLTKILKEKFNYDSDLKSYSHQELWETNQIIEAHTFSFSTLFKKQSESDIYHLEVYSFWEGYFSSSVNKRNLDRIEKVIKNNEEFYKKIYQEMYLVIQNQYKDFYEYQLSKLDEKIKQNKLLIYFK